MYPKELRGGSQKGICMLIFMAVLLPRGKTQKPHKCPPRDECINEMWHIQWENKKKIIKKIKN